MLHWQAGLFCVLPLIGASVSVPCSRESCINLSESWRSALILYAGTVLTMQLKWPVWKPGKSVLITVDAFVETAFHEGAKEVEIKKKKKSVFITNAVSHPQRYCTA